MPWVSPKLLTAAGCDRDEASLPRHAEACSSLSIDPWWQEKPRHWRAPFEILSFVSLQWLIVSILLKLIKSYTLYKYLFWVVGLAVYIHVLSAWKLSHKIWADHIRTLQQLQPSFVPSSYSCEPSEEGLKDSAPCGSTAVVAPPVSFVLSPISGFQRAKAPSQPSIASNGGRFTTATSAYLGRAFRQSNGCMYASSAMWAVCSLLLLMSLWKTVKRGPLVYYSLLSFFDEKPAESSWISESKIPLQLFDVHVPSALWYPSKEKQGGKTARKKKRKIPKFPAIESLQKAFDRTKANLWWQSLLFKENLATETSGAGLRSQIF